MFPPSSAPEHARDAAEQPTNDCDADLRHYRPAQVWGIIPEQILPPTGKSGINQPKAPVV